MTGCKRNTQMLIAAFLFQDLPCVFHQYKLLKIIYSSFDNAEVDGPSILVYYFCFQYSYHIILYIRLLESSKHICCHIRNYISSKLNPLIITFWDEMFNSDVCYPNSIISFETDYSAGLYLSFTGDNKLQPGINFSYFAPMMSCSSIRLTHES